MTPIYVVTDVEVDGPNPGDHSMMSFASVAIDSAGTEIAAFEAMLLPLEEATPDAETIAWFKTHPDAYAAAAANPKTASEVMSDYAR